MSSEGFSGSRSLAVFNKSRALVIFGIIALSVLAVFILVEKLMPWGRRFSQISGFLMIAWGIWIFSRL
jgi:predicted metal-binding membrane protein